MSLVISANNLSKAYKLYSKPMDRLKEMILRRPCHTPFWALRDISFELMKGEMIAFIGKNGAGKSTLLKIIANTLEPTSGEFTLNGRVASILELGTGFNPEYTGRENIKVGGLCLGLSAKEVEEKTDWIIDFSELREFIDYPFKTYSSGMQARLTFATASCIDPDVLIVDEGLSVGDVKFQAKCFARLNQFREAGGTVLLVSHDLNTINTLCTRAYYLKDSRIHMQGVPKEVTAAYLNDMFRGNPPVSRSSTMSVARPQSTSELPPVPAISREFVEERLSKPPVLGTGAARIIRTGFIDAAGNEVSTFTPYTEYFFYVTVFFVENIDYWHCSMHLSDVKGQLLLLTGTKLHDIELPQQQANSMCTVYFKLMLPLINQEYLFTVAIGDGELAAFDKLEYCTLVKGSPAKALSPNSIVAAETEIFYNSL